MPILIEFEKGNVVDDSEGFVQEENNNNNNNFNNDTNDDNNNNEIQSKDNNDDSDVTFVILTHQLQRHLVTTS